MMQELDNHQEKENSLQRHAASQYSAEMQSANGRRSEQLSNSNPRRTSARRSLDYSGFPVQKPAGSDYSLSHGFDDSQSSIKSDFISNGGRKLDGEIVKRGMDDSVTQEVDTAEAKKRVRIVSPDVTTSPYMDEEPPPSSTHHQMSNSPDVHVTGNLV